MKPISSIHFFKKIGHAFDVVAKKYLGNSRL
jgi:hypothetical protein